MCSLVVVSYVEDELEDRRAWKVLVRTLGLETAVREQRV